VKAEQLSAKFDIEKERLSINNEAEQAQLIRKGEGGTASRAYELKRARWIKLKVRAASTGMLQSVPRRSPRWKKARR